MGRLDIEIRHGHHGGSEWGAVIALLAFIVLAIAGGAGHKAISGAMHDVLTAVEVAAWTLAAVVILAAAAGVTWAVLRVRRAVRAHRAIGNARPPVVYIDQNGYHRPIPADTARPALDTPRRPAGSWPLPGQWHSIRPNARHDDDRRRYS
jgi:hypothetical protein